MTIIITIIIHVIKTNNKNYSCEKFDRHKWPTNCYIDWSIASLGRKMANGRPLYYTLVISTSVKV